MAWVKLDDQLINHPKIECIGVVGLGLHVAALCYANQQLTDGFISTTRVPLLIDMTDVDRRWDDAKETDHPALLWAAALVDAGVWEVAEGGYQIHDYLKYQPSRRSVLKERSTRRSIRAAAGQQGGKQTASKRAANVQQNGKQTGTPVARSPIPVLDVANATSSAAAWYQRVYPKRGTIPIPDEILTTLKAIDAAHPEACVAAAFGRAEGKQQPWAYAQTVLGSCEKEGHLPRGGNGASGQRVPARTGQNQSRAAGVGRSGQPDPW